MIEKSTRQAERFSAPKADALPGCATPRAAVSLGIAREKGNRARQFRGNERRNAARTGAETPEYFPNRVTRLLNAIATLGLSELTRRLKIDQRWRWLLLAAVLLNEVRGVAVVYAIVTA
jgi:hypothetical protein